MRIRIVVKGGNLSSAIDYDGDETKQDVSLVFLEFDRMKREFLDDFVPTVRVEEN